jgi:mono/diheme cytochrome c family protein
MFSRIPVSLVSLLVVAAVLTGVSAAPLAAQGRTILDGVYTEAQADLGKAAVDSNCSGCHQADLSGGSGPSLKGERFIARYVESDLGALFNRIKTTMPRENAGSLTDETYIDIVAYILQMNAFPTGRGALSVNLAREIKIVGKADTGPVPDFALVQLVGCLMQGPDNTWVLQNASAPVRTRNPEKPTEADLQAAKGQALGAMSFRLLYADTFSPEFKPADHTGRKMEGRGFLITKPENRISITWLARVDEACAP